MPPEYVSHETFGTNPVAISVKCPCLSAILKGFNCMLTYARGLQMVYSNALEMLIEVWFQVAPIGKFLILYTYEASIITHYEKIRTDTPSC